MVLNRSELLSALNGEIRLLLHLLSKVEPEMLNYRPTPKQRSLLELLQYLTYMGPIHARAVKAGGFEREAWGKEWMDCEAAARALDLEQIKESVAWHPTLYGELFGNSSDDEFRTEIQMFGGKASRGSMIVSLVLNHYAAYRMQVFLYLKAAGREELDTLNLWAGMDPAAR